MKNDRLMFWLGFTVYAAGLLLYAVAFLLPAVAAPGSAPLRGYDCAVYVTLQQPWTHENRALIGEPFKYIPLVLSGWINPLFLVTAILIPFRKPQRVVGILRVIILLLIPFCWIVFYHETIRPREGHFLWMMGMVLVLFSNKLKKVNEKMPL